MADNIYRGLTISFNGDTVDFDESVQAVNEKLKKLKTTYNEAFDKMKADPTDIEKINEALKILEQRMDELKKKKSMFQTVYSQTKQELKEIDKELVELEKSYKNGSISEEEFKNKTEELKDKQQDLNVVYSASAKQIKSIDNELKTLQNTYKKVKENTISDHFKELADKAGLASDALKKVSDATRLVSTAATGGLVASAKAAGDFEQSIVSVNKVLRERNGIGIEQIEEQIKDMAQRIPVDIATIADSFAMASQLGVYSDDLSNFVETMLRLDSATNINSVEGATQIAQLFNVIGSDIQSVDEFANALVRLGNTSATTEQDILNMAETIGASASNVGFTSYQILGLADALASAGLNASSGGSSLSTILTNIDKSAAGIKNNWQPLNKFAKLLGVTNTQFKYMWTVDAAGTFVKLVGAIKEAVASGENINTVLGNIDISGIKQDRTMKALVGHYEGLTEAMISSYDAFTNGQDAVNEANAAWDTFNSNIQLLWNNLKLVAVELGNVILPVLEPLVQKVIEFAQWLGSLNDVQKELIVKIMGILAVISPVTGFLAKLLGSSGLKGIYDWLAKLTKGSGFHDWLTRINEAAGGTGGLFGIVKGIIAQMSVWQQVLLGVVAVFAALYLGNEDFRNSVNTLVRNVVDTMLPVIMDIIGYLSRIITALGSSLKPFIEAIVNFLVQMLPIILNGLSLIFDLIRWAWENILKPLFDFFTLLFEGISAGFEVIFTALKEGIDWLSKFTDGVLGAIGRVKDLFGWNQKVSQNTPELTSNTTGTRVSLPPLPNRLMDTGGFGVNTNGLAMMSGGVGALTLNTSINVNNNGTPIDETTIRRWGNTITDVVSKNLGRRL